jgi:DNA polymerase-3 subunit delta'
MADPVTDLLSTVRAQPVATGTLRRALSAGRVHHAYLFDGPPGVGKELTAFGLAQALVCERRGEREAQACGACSACRRAVPQGEGRMAKHPDVVVLARGLYDPAQIGRRSPETQDISIDQVRTLVLAHAAYGPHEGRARVFLLRRAEELSIPAANAMLKTLEEPGQRTHFVLITSHVETLLPTIRSRTQRLRFAALPDDVVVDLLVERGHEAARARQVARLAGGSMEAALGLVDGDENAGREGFVTNALAALEAKGVGPALEVAEEAKKTSRDALAARLAALAGTLAANGRETLGSRAGEVAAARYSLAIAAIEQLDGNAAAQLVVESMLIRMRNA